MLPLVDWIRIRNRLYLMDRNVRIQTQKKGTRQTHLDYSGTQNILSMIPEPDEVKSPKSLTQSKSFKCNAIRHEMRHNGASSPTSRRSAIPGSGIHCQDARVRKSLNACSFLIEFYRTEFSGGKNFSIITMKGDTVDSSIIMIGCGKITGERPGRFSTSWRPYTEIRALEIRRDDTGELQTSDHHFCLSIMEIMKK